MSRFITPRQIFASLLVVTALGLGSGAHALSYSGVLTIQYTGSADVPLLSVSGGGTSSDGPGGSFALAPGDFTGTDFELGGPAVLPAVAALDLSVASGAGSFGPSGGTMSVGGMMTQYFFSFDPGFGVPIPLASVGVGGSDPFSAPVGGGTVSGTITGSDWTTGMVTVTGATGPLVASGLDARGPDGLGTIVLVTGLQVKFDGIQSLQEPVPGLATLTLTFVPEPGTALLVALGTTVLASRRQRRS